MLIDSPSAVLIKPSFRRVPTGRHVVFGVNRHVGAVTLWNSWSSEHLLVWKILSATGTSLATISLSKPVKVVEPMKIESILTGVLLAGGTNLFARVLSQGVESALVATAIEWSARRIREAGKIFRSPR